MNVLHANIYVVGVELNFEGNQYYLVAVGGMTLFSVVEPTAEKKC